MGIPSFDILLHIAGVDDSIFIARDYSATFIDKGMIKDYSILVPDSAMFVINSYYAGAGYYYYGLKETGTPISIAFSWEEGAAPKQRAKTNQHENLSY
ncbi:MAG: hypothetical protein IPM82_23275 [Saprospiraceae bacterium]|nr:hypothetical protein [Saprospiraceae bacterium]